MIAERARQKCIGLKIRNTRKTGEICDNICLAADACRVDFGDRDAVGYEAR